MPRFHATDKGNIPFTAEEEAEHDAHISAAKANRINDIRAERDRRLSETDWRALPDITPLQMWVDYRQSLRDFPGVVDLDDIVWPTPPA